jgi:MYXO-CTERM domain-containing protein
MRGWARLAVALFVIAVPTIANADAIVPFEGECPPGLVRGMADHAEGCFPRACTSDAECGAGAACREIRECWAPREHWGGRVRLEQPEMRDTMVGLCARDGTCAEGQCRARRQCEPTAPTPAWSPEQRRWTGQPHPPRGLCSVGVPSSEGDGVLAIAVLALATIALRRRRHSLGATSISARQ